MTPKGHTPVDLLSAEPVSTRRSIIGAVGAVGVAAAVGVLATTRPAAAAPYSPTDADRGRLDVLMKLELTASDLYQASLGAGLDGVAADVATTFAENHRLYAQAIAGITGLSASGRLDDVYDRFEIDFATSTEDTWARSAYELESTFVATHTEAIAEFEAVEAVNLITSILVIEARQAVVSADIGGFADDGSVLDADGVEAIELPEVSA